jgi:hypothetical protein
VIKFDGLEKALIGQASVWGDGERVERLIYSGEKIIDVLMKRDDMSYEEAQEFIDYNIEGLYAGPSTPVIVWPTEGEID